MTALIQSIKCAHCFIIQLCLLLYIVQEIQHNAVTFAEILLQYLALFMIVKCARNAVLLPGMTRATRSGTSPVVDVIMLGSAPIYVLMWWTNRAPL